MLLSEIITYTRYRLYDSETTYKWSDDELVLYANEANNIICRDGSALEDSFTESTCRLFAVADTLDYSLSTNVIYVKSAKCVTLELLTLDVMPVIAWAAGDTITGATSLKSCTVVEKLTDYTYTVKNRNGTFTLGEILSNGTYTADQGTTYPKFTDYSTTQFMKKSSTYDQNSRYSNWRSCTHNEPTTYILDYSNGYFTVYPKPDQVYPIYLTVVRYPITAFSTTSMSTQTPEIDSRYHHALVDGICYQAYLKGSVNTYNPEKSNTHLQLFRKAISDMKIQNNMFTATDATMRAPRGFI